MPGTANDWPHNDREADQRFRPIRTPRSLGALASFARRCQDQLKLELGKSSDHRQQEPPVRRCRVRPGVAKRSKSGPSLGDCRRRVQQIPSVRASLSFHNARGGPARTLPLHSSQPRKALQVDPQLRQETAKLDHPSIVASA